MLDPESLALELELDEPESELPEDEPESEELDSFFEDSAAALALLLLRVP